MRRKNGGNFVTIVAPIAALEIALPLLHTVSSWLSGHGRTASEDLEIAEMMFSQALRRKAKTWHSWGSRISPLYLPRQQWRWLLANGNGEIFFWIITMAIIVSGKYQRQIYIQVFLENFRQVNQKRKINQKPSILVATAIRCRSRLIYLKKYIQLQPELCHYVTYWSESASSLPALLWDIF